MTFLIRSTVKGVELVKAGEWNGLAGKVNLTEQDLQDAVTASTDPEVDHAVVKLGHIDPRFDGQPAAGWVQNLRLSEDRRTLIGDLVDMPQKLAAMMTDAYKRRSAELRRGVTTPSGKKYGTVLSGLALLGVQAPAVKGLSDVLAQYASENPGHEDDATDTSMDTLMLGDTPPVPPAPGAAGESGGTATPTGTTKTETPPNGKGQVMDEKMLAKLRKRLGLEDTADEAAVLAALEQEADEAEAAVPGAPGEKPAEKPEDKPGEKPAEPVEPAAPVAQAASEGGDTVTVPKATWDRMTATVTSLSEKARKDEDEAMLSEALRTGRLTPPEVEAWQAGLTDEARRPGTIAMLSALPQKVAVIELGDGSATAAPDVDEKVWAEQADAMGL